MKLYIRNMVSLRCKIIVKETLEKIGIHFTVVELGEVDINEKISDWELQLVRVALSHYGLVVMDDRKKMLIEKIKHVIIELVHQSEEQLQINFSNYLSTRLQYDYTYLANIFSASEGMTIERYIIAHKIERVKELLHYDELSLTKIAHKLHYSSVGHVSNQFKKMTGMSPSLYKRQRHQLRQTLESLH